MSQKESKINVDDSELIGVIEQDEKIDGIQNWIGEIQKLGRYYVIIKMHCLKKFYKKNPELLFETSEYDYEVNLDGLSRSNSF